MKVEDWKDTTLGEILSFEYGTGLPEEERSGYGFPVFGSSGEVGRHKDFLVVGPGIVVGRKGTVGAVFWSGESFWPIDTTYFVKTKRPIDLQWCYWLLSRLPLKRLDSSTGVPGLNRNDAYAISLKLPPPPEQVEIAAILATVDEVIQKTDALISKLKRMKQGLMQDLLSRGIDEKGKIRSEKTHKFKDSPLGRIPVEWVVSTVSRCLDSVDYRGKSPEKTTDGIFLVTSRNIKNGRIDYSLSQEFVDEEDYA